MTEQTENETPTVVERNLERELEAILMVADQPQSVIELSAALDAPVQALKDAIASLVADYNGLTGGPEPVTRSQVSAIRAVNVDTVIRTLQGRGLIRESHTDPETGAIFYVTTDLLLAELGIESLEDLPPLSPLLDDGAEGFDDVD